MKTHVRDQNYTVQLNKETEPLGEIGIQAIKAVVEELFLQDNSPSLMFTNLKQSRQDSFYCLVISKKQLQLAWKIKGAKSVSVFDIEKEELFIDGFQYDLALLSDLQSKIMQILEDVKANRATVCKGGSS